MTFLLDSFFFSSHYREDHLFSLPVLDLRPVEATGGPQTGYLRAPQGALCEARSDKSSEGKSHPGR